MRIGAHVDSGDPLHEAHIRGAEIVQFFLTDPKKWNKPVPREDASALKDSDVDVVIHAPYVVNLASTNNRIRIPSRTAVAAQAKAAAEVGALGLVVHGGHVTAADDPAEGIRNWRKAFEGAARDGGFAVPILIENTAGGENAMARHLDRLAQLWDAIGEFEPGFCLDTCHAHAAGEELTTIVECIKAITGRIDLVHANNSRDPFDSGRDRHENLADGEIDPDLLCEVVSAAQAPAVVETPGGAEAQQRDIALLRERVK